MGGMVPLPDEVLKEIHEMVSVGEETKHIHLDLQNELGEWNAIDDLEVEEEWR
jgi:hypothetical protein